MIFLFPLKLNLKGDIQYEIISLICLLPDPKARTSVSYM